MRVFGSFGGRSFFGVVCVFFPRRGIVSGYLLIRFGDVGWAWAYAFMGVCFLWLTY